MSLAVIVNPESNFIRIAQENCRVSTLPGSTKQAVNWLHYWTIVFTFEKEIPRLLLMKSLKIRIIDLVSKGPTNTFWARIMHANLASIMPQVVAVWCEEEGHEVELICYTGSEKIDKELQAGVDLVFICSFTQAALLAYSISNYLRSKGVITVLGGPHARCYPDDAVKYFDYVLGLTDQSIIRYVLEDCKPNPVIGRHLSAAKQPNELPGVRRRWKFIQPTLKKAPFIKIVPMLGSVGCPYACSFCIDSVIAYQQLSFDVMQDDLKFLLTKFRKPVVGWHDPNFGIRFKENMKAISDAAEENSFTFIAESSLSILTEDHVKTMKQNGFEAFLPGIESWYEMGEKSRTVRLTPKQKLEQVSEQVNMILRYVPYIQTNFVLGLDSDAGDEPFELSKQFVDRSPGAFPGYSLLTSFGEAAPRNMEYQKEDRVIPFPFHFLNNHLAMNLKPKNYEWVAFYQKVIDLTEYTFSKKAIYKRFLSTSRFTAKWMNFMRAISSEGYGRIRFFKKVKENLVNDRSFRAYFEKETRQLPQFYRNIIQKDLGDWWQWLPTGALDHDENAYLHKMAVTNINTDH
ncbi:MAG: B12-binding domain-containing radical SAM protein [Flavisolibacter sp.]